MFNVHEKGNAIKCFCIFGIKNIFKNIISHVKDIIMVDRDGKHIWCGDTTMDRFYHRNYSSNYSMETGKICSYDSYRPCYFPSNFIWSGFPRCF